MIARRRQIRKAYAAELAEVPGVRVLATEGVRGDEADN
jgi:hypothetical protein